jgi:choline dehydrogenase
MMSWHSDTEGLSTAASPANAELLQREGRGPLTSNVAEACGFVRTREGLEAPDIQLNAVPANADIGEEGLAGSTTTGFGLGACVLKPTSRGKLSLRTGDPGSKPRILHNYFATEEDRRSVIEGVRIALDIAAQPALRAHIKAPNVVPNSMSAADVWDYVRRYASTISPDQHLRDRTRGRQRAQGAWRRKAAGRGRFGHAERRARQHQRADDHDRREGRRSDPRREHRRRDGSLDV